jgi:cellulose synthase/poly-beta-1,6-N-acetylglucosamine synthase-like glycosyltransferase
MPVIEIIYAICVLAVSVYGLNSLVLTMLYVRQRRGSLATSCFSREAIGQPEAGLPRVTVQLPIYNELHTVERLLRAVAALDYHRQQLEIQVLDDSTDNTRRLASRLVCRLQTQGLDIVHITREDRAGFKAGALAEGLVQASGELIAIFDADFLPPRDFLMRTVSLFKDPDVGCVQTRWGHLNRGYSAFTRTQALGVDGHFVVEQAARHRAGLLINFNGTGGLWRRACIEDAGGWQADTLTEDLDLSYRAQLRGWRFSYLPDVVVPAELPVQIRAFKRQQARWAQGSIQTALKLLGPLLRSTQPWTRKLEGAIHLTSYLVHPLMLIVLFLTLPMGFSHSWVLVAAPWLMVAALGPPLMYAVAAVADGEGRRKRLRVLPLLVLLGMGLALSNTRAVLRALLGREQGFERTPKFALRTRGDQWVGSLYALSDDGLVWAELALTLFAIALLVVPGVHWGFAPWLLLYGAGFGYVALLSLKQMREHRRWLARPTRSTASKAARIVSTEPNRIPAEWQGRGR